MARVRLVTRTVTITTVVTMTLNIDTSEVGTAIYEMNGEYPDMEECLKLIKKYNDTDTIKNVVIKSMSKSDVLYGMPESEFIKYAKELPPRSNTEE